MTPARPTFQIRTCPGLARLVSDAAAREALAARRAETVRRLEVVVATAGDEQVAVAELVLRSYRLASALLEELSDRVLPSA